jgi:hypothetical protein
MSVRGRFTNKNPSLMKDEAEHLEGLVDVYDLHCGYKEEPIVASMRLILFGEPTAGWGRLRWALVGGSGVTGAKMAPECEAREAELHCATSVRITRYVGSR